MPSDSYLGEIIMVGFNFAPVGFALCNGQLVPIDQFAALFNLIGTTYGGDGQTTFGLPDLRGRIPVHQGNGWTIGEFSGVESVSLTTSQIPAHSHNLRASANAGASVNAAGNVLASPRRKLYDVPGSPAAMAGSAIGLAGGSQPHSNIQPVVCINFAICLFGVYPTQN